MRRRVEEMGFKSFDMKYKNNPIVVTCSSLALASALIFSTAVQAQPSSTPSSSSKSASGQSANPSATTPTQSGYGTPSVYGDKANERTGALGQNKDKQKLQEQTTKDDAALKAQVASMNRAPEGQKVALMAGIITTMVEQRAAANARTDSDDHSQSMSRDGHPSARDTTPGVTAPSATTPYSQSK